MKKRILVLLAFAGASFLPAQDDATKTPKDFTCELLPRALPHALPCTPAPMLILGDPPCSLGGVYACLEWEPQPARIPNRLWVSDSAGDSVVVCEIDDGKVHHCVLKGTHTLDDVVQAWEDVNKILAPRPAHAKSKKEQP